MCLILKRWHRGGSRGDSDRLGAAPLLASAAEGIFTLRVTGCCLLAHTVRTGARPLRCRLQRAHSSRLDLRGWEAVVAPAVT